MQHKVIMEGVRPGVRTISVVKLIERDAGLTLKPAKECVDRLLSGVKVEVAFPSEEAIVRFLHEVDQLGVVAQRMRG